MSEIYVFIEYCRGITRLFLDGQHGTCVVARISQKVSGVVLTAEIIERDNTCSECNRKAHFEEKKIK